MRVIKVRVWDSLFGLFVYFNVSNPSQADLYGFEKFQKIEKQQFTDLLDKNGKEIYEGDYLGDYEDEQWICYGAVSFYDYNATYILIGEDGYSTDYETYDNSDWDKFEVIGNIYENPELLAGVK